jgi:hypothetical protein
MNRHGEHPTYDDFLAFLGGDMNSNQSFAMFFHLAECSCCRESVDTLALKRPFSINLPRPQKTDVAHLKQIEDKLVNAIYQSCLGGQLVETIRQTK